jgi:hypothetical protein
MRAIQAALSAAAHCAVLALIGFQGPAHGADGARSVDIEIVGIVPESCNIALDNSRVVFDLSKSVQQVRIATITESCNRSAGYVVTVRSSQNGMLSSSAGGIGYSATYGGEPVDLAGGAVIERDTQNGPQPRDLLVTIPQGNYAGGVYRDVITVEISAQ